MYVSDINHNGVHREADIKSRNKTIIRSVIILGILFCLLLGAISLANSYIYNGSLTIFEIVDFRGSPSESRALTPYEYYQMGFSTYIGGSAYEHARDVFVDSSGYIYIVGGTTSTDFPITIGPAFNTNQCNTLGSAGRSDVFVSKFDQGGNLIWSRLVGGPCYDRAYGVEVDSQGFIYIAGRAGDGFPVTPGSFQPAFQGTDAGPYGYQNAFAAKLSPDGSNIVWASYVGVGQMARDIAIDPGGNVYVPLGYSGQGGTPPAAWFINAFQPTPSGMLECGAIKISADGSQVIWASWLGGSNDDGQEGSIRVDSNGSVYLTFFTFSSDVPTSPGAFDQTYNGGRDRFVARFSADGSDLIFGTYLGGSGDEGVNTHTLAIDNQGFAYIPTWTTSTNFPTTTGVFQDSYNGGATDIAVTKLSPTGGLVASTYIGGSNKDDVDGIYVDNSGNVFITGSSDSSNFPITVDAYQASKSAGMDSVLVRLSPDFRQLLYATYLGGNSNDDGRSGYFGADGSMYVTGQTDGSGWPILNAYQTKYAGGTLDAILAKFAPSSLPGQTSTPTLVGAPTATITPPPNPGDRKVYFPLLDIRSYQ